MLTGRQPPDLGCESTSTIHLPPYFAICHISLPPPPVAVVYEQLVAFSPSLMRL